jgi:hypothetical protein
MKNKINSNYVTGFADGEACWSIKVYKNNKLKIGWAVLPVFSIELSAIDIDLLYRIQSFFGVGHIGINRTRGSASYSVTSTKDLVEVIIPHFDNYPLLSQKRGDFLLFKLSVELINKKEHLTTEGLNKIISLKASLNWGLSKVLKEEYPGIVPEERPLVEETENIDPF